MMCSLTFSMLAFALPAYAQQIDFSALVRYGETAPVHR